MLINELHVKLKCAEELHSQCSVFVASNLQGSEKLLRKIEIELAFLKQFLKDTRKLKPCYLECTNVKHFKAIVDNINKYSDVVAVLKPFHYSQSPDSKALIVDIVADGGLTWVKTVARNAEGLHRAWTGDMNKPATNVVTQGRNYLLAAEENLHMFCKPKVVFDFTSGVPSRIADELQNCNIDVRGSVVHVPYVDDISSESDDNNDDDYDNNDQFGDSEENTCQLSSELCLLDSTPVDPKSIPLSLDITAMFALISNLTNGFAQFTFAEPLLDQQAAWEREKPALPFLKSLIAGRKLLCCRTAYNSFMSILSTVGGTMEKQRTEKLMDTVTIVEDSISERASRLKVGGKIKYRSKIIFGTADELRSVILTANKGFLYAAENQGVRFTTILHEPRALSEDKQKHAVEFLTAGNLT